jgi:Mg/Co/Ni transporter MgtE
MNTQRIDSIVQLIESLPEAERTVVMRRLMQSHTAQVVLDLEQRLKAFEARYQMPSDEFYRQFQDGALGDGADFFEWSAYYGMLTEAEAA